MKKYFKSLLFFWCCLHLSYEFSNAAGPEEGPAEFGGEASGTHQPVAVDSEGGRAEENGAKQPAPRPVEIFQARNSLGNIPDNLQGMRRKTSYREKGGGDSEDLKLGHTVKRKNYSILHKDDDWWVDHRNVRSTPSSSPFAASGYKELVGGRDFVVQENISTTVSIFAKVEEITGPEGIVDDVIHVIQEVHASPFQNRNLRIGSYSITIDLMQKYDERVVQQAQQEIRFIPYPIPNIARINNTETRVETETRAAVAFERRPFVALTHISPTTGIGSLRTQDGFNMGLAMGGGGPSGTLGINRLQARETADIEVSSCPYSIHPRWTYTINNISIDRAKTSATSISGSYIKNEWTWRIDQDFARRHLYHHVLMDGKNFYFLGMRAFLEITVSKPCCGCAYDSRNGCFGCLGGCLCNLFCCCCTSMVPHDKVPINVLGMHEDDPRVDRNEQDLYFHNIIPIDPTLFSEVRRGPEEMVVDGRSEIPRYPSS